MSHNAILCKFVNTLIVLTPTHRYLFRAKINRPELYLYMETRFTHVVTDRRDFVLQRTRGVPVERIFFGTGKELPVEGPCYLLPLKAE